jgi:hypothetical protein
MSRTPSFERINYILRPNKQVERKMILDILSHISLSIGISEYNYIGMGSIYYYDFILMHKYLNIRKMVSIDNKSTVKRFIFNKPYDFIQFENCDTSEYLYRHSYNEKSIFWLDYDGSIIRNEPLVKDISILGKNCREDDFYFVTIRCDSLKDDNSRENFLNSFSKYIPPPLRVVKNTAPGNYPFLIQEILLNMLAESTEFNDNKFLKLFSFLYKDGALMYTLGGIFTSNPEELLRKNRSQMPISNSREEITEIKLPHITYKEKYYLDSNITTIEQMLRYSHEHLSNTCYDETEYVQRMEKYLSNELDFELSQSDLTNYVKNYRFVPQYYEGII